MLNLKIHHEVLISHSLEIVPQFSDYRTFYSKDIILWVAALLHYNTRPWLSKNNLKNDDIPEVMGKISLLVCVAQRALEAVGMYGKL